jgi:hypothetical protein
MEPTDTINTQNTKAQIEPKIVKDIPVDNELFDKEEAKELPVDKEIFDLSSVLGKSYSEVVSIA